MGATMLMATAANAAPVANGLQGGSYNAGHGGSNCCGSPTQMSDRDFQEALTGRRPALGGSGSAGVSGRHGVTGGVRGDSGGHSPGSKGWR